MKTPKAWNDHFFIKMKISAAIILFLCFAINIASAHADITMEGEYPSMSLISTDGEVIFSCAYIYETTLSYVFSDESDQWGFYDKRSGYLQLPTYDGVYDLNCIDADTPILVEKEGMIGYLNRENGEVVIPFQYTPVFEYSEFYNGYAIVRKDTLGLSDSYIDVLINEEGKEIAFPDGLMPFSFVCDGKVVLLEPKVIDDHEEYLYGLGTVEGDIFLRPQYDFISDFSEGYASICQNGLWGHMNSDGVVVVPPTYDIDEEGQLGGYFFENGIAELLLEDGSTIYIDYLGHVLQ